jgi:hypothetical protein
VAGYASTGIAHPLLLAITLAVIRMGSPVLAPIPPMPFTPGALCTSLVVAVVRIRLTLAPLPPASAFALAVRLTTETLLGILRARPKTRPAGCTPPALHG